MLFDTDVLIRVLHKSTKTAKEIDKDDNRFISAVNDAEGTEQTRADVLVFATACKNSLTLCSANKIFFRNIASPDAKAIVPENSDALRLVLSSPLNGFPVAEKHYCKTAGNRFAIVFFCNKQVLGDRHDQDHAPPVRLGLSSNCH